MFEQAQMNAPIVFKREVGNSMGAMGVYLWNEPCVEKDEECLKLITSEADRFAIVHNKRDELHDADDIFVRVLEDKKETFGDTNMSTLRIMNTFGVIYMENGKLDKAKEIFDQALVGEKEISDAWKLKTMHNSAVLCMKRGELAEADAMLLPTLEEKKRLLEYNDPSILDTLITLGILRLKQDRPKEAEEFFCMVRGAADTFVETE